MDDFLEYLVRRKNTTKTTVLKVLIVFGAVIFTLIMLILSMTIRTFSFIFLLLIAGGIYGAWYLLGTFKVEYEYIVTNGEMDVDKIMSQRKRKRLISINFRNMDIMAPMGGEHKQEFENQSIQKTIDASISQDTKGAYFIVVRHAKLGFLRLVFNPNERIIKSAKMVAPRKVFTD